MDRPGERGGREGEGERGGGGEVGERTGKSDEDEGRDYIVTHSTIHMHSMPVSTPAHTG